MSYWDVKSWVERMMIELWEKKTGSAQSIPYLTLPYLRFIFSYSSPHLIASVSMLTVVSLFRNSVTGVMSTRDAVSLESLLHFHQVGRPSSFCQSNPTRLANVWQILRSAVMRISRPSSSRSLSFCWQDSRDFEAAMSQTKMNGSFDLDRATFSLRLSLTKPQLPLRARESTI